MTLKEKYALYRDDDHEFLGYVEQDAIGWQAQTIFGYLIERTTSQQDAERALQEKGLAYLTGVWQYFDPDEKQWFSCVIKEANQYRVTVVRTSQFGYHDPELHKVVILEAPTENELVKAV
jgi:hypothetical protein